ncbi:MAG TPA: decarboxylating 6-phosphogluconate dehydrogenase [Anaerolineales bacterium]|nr:decarboxylating 6-phosphogluconate dehydrogenase [Anaerolineales bacterium]
MKIAMVGLGKMGGNMVARLLRGGHQIVATNRGEEAIRKAEAEGAIGARNLDEVLAHLDAPRTVWIMVPSGDPTEQAIRAYAERLSPGDTIIDGGNSNYKDTMRRGAMLAEKGLHFVDVGTSGGIWGITEGYSMMIGGEKEAVERLRPIFETLAPAPDKGWGHVGPSGSGHFVKMIHNGIEYGMMQAFAEGFEIFREKKEFGLDLHQIAEIWQHGSVVRSWLLDLTARALEDDQSLSDIAPFVPDSGEGRWTVFEAVDLDVPAPVLTLALQMRFVSRQDERYAARLLSALRNQFGGHAVKKAE